MTEEEAKTKWCPFARPVAWGGGNRGHVSGADIEDAQCIGSACMAWRWTSVGMQYEHAGHGGRERGNGHCGLAGKP